MRERRSDIPALVELLAEDMALRSGGAPPELGVEAMSLLSAQAWRGNIRELRNVLEQAAMRSDSGRLGAPELEAVLRESGVEQPASRARAVPARRVERKRMVEFCLLSISVTGITTAATPVCSTRLKPL